MTNRDHSEHKMRPAGRPGSRCARGAATALAAGALALAGTAPAQARPIPPRAATGGASHVLASSALLTGTVNPDGAETTYYFRYGPTNTYGLQTGTAALPAGTTKVKVGAPVTGLLRGGTYHFRLVAVNANGTAEGRDHQFKTRGASLAFEVPKNVTDVYGTPLVLSGALKGQNAPGHRIALQASPFPYLEPFATIGVPGVTNAVGRFSFRVANLLASTQLRVVTLDPLPLISHVIAVSVAVRVTLHVRTSHTGLVRLYGTITPAVSKAKVFLQLHKPIRPDKKENTARWSSQFTTAAKRNGVSSSRFSLVAKVRRTGRYRAFVKLPAGPLVSGASSTVVLRAPKQ
jgi:hypothetical protein